MKRITTMKVSKPYRYARKIPANRPSCLPVLVSKPYRYARKDHQKKCGRDPKGMFQNLIGMLGRDVELCDTKLYAYVSKPYRYARKHFFTLPFFYFGSSFKTL